LKKELKKRKKLKKEDALRRKNDNYSEDSNNVEKLGGLG